MYRLAPAQLPLGQSLRLPREWFSLAAYARGKRKANVSNHADVKSQMVVNQDARKG